jgi:glutaminyl-tRNA synthetase
MSKRYLKKLVDTEAVDGWDDPRMPTLAGLRRRGYTASAIKDFCARTGVAKANSEVETGQLEYCIREELNNTAERAMAVLDPLELVITNRPDNFKEKLDFSYTVNGIEKTRQITFSNRLFIEREDFSLNPPPKYIRLFVGGIVRLKSGYIIKCPGIEKDQNGQPIKVLAEIIEGTKSGESQTNAAGNPVGGDPSGAPQDPPIKAKGTIHWVNAKDSIEIEARLYDYLLIDGNEDKDFSERLNPDSLIIKKAYAEPFLKKAKKGKSFQFLRLAYFVRDIKSEALVFNRIVGLKDTQKAKV